MNFLPEDWQDAILVGRIDLGEGPTPILVHKGEVLDVSAIAPTVSALLNAWDGTIPKGKSLGPLDGFGFKPLSFAVTAPDAGTPDHESKPD